MSTLLHISASPRGKDSESLLLSEAFLQEFRLENPDTEIDSLDLWSESLPAFDGVRVGAKMAVIAGARPTGKEAVAWQTVQQVFDRFNAAERYLFSVPMWNASIPYVLKHYIDVITQPRMAFGFHSESGYYGLLTNKRAAVIYTSGIYAPGVPASFGTDFHSTYFDNWLHFIGIRDISIVRFQPTLLNAEIEADRERSLQEARDLGARF